MEIGCRAGSVLNPLITKNKKNIVFFESAPGFMNNYVLMKYMVQNGLDKEYNIYYFPDIRVECNLGKTFERVRFSNNLMYAYFLFLTSFYVFIDTGNMRMTPSKGQCVVYMDHGLPFKLAGILRKSFDWTFPRDLVMPVNYFPSSSPNFDDMYCATYCLDKKQIIRCGRPRTDALYKEKSYLGLLGIDKGQYSKIIMWMTTYRIASNGRAMDTESKNWSKTNLPILTDMQEIRRVNDYLRERNFLLVIKIHQGSVFRKESIQNLSNLKLLLDKDFVNKGVQIYDILKDFDALVTDYSSVFLDYVIVDKPIIFITDDIEEFSKRHGFFFDNPLEYMPGPKVNSYDELISQLDRLDDNATEYKETRKKLKDFCHYYQDGHDSARLLELLNIR